MTDDTSPAGPAHPRPASPSAIGPSATGPSAHAQFEFRPARGPEPATVRAAGDIDLANLGQFQAALDQAAAFRAMTVDLTAVTYCDSATIRALFMAARRAQLTIAVSTAGSVTGTLLKISGLDQIATVVALRETAG